MQVGTDDYHEAIHGDINMNMTAVFANSVDGGDFHHHQCDLFDHISSRDVDNPMDDDDDDDIAVAAEAAANAVEAADAAVAANAAAHDELVDFGGAAAVDLVKYSVAHDVDATGNSSNDDDTGSSSNDVPLPPATTCRICFQSSITNSSSNRPLLHFEPTEQKIVSSSTTVEEANTPTSSWEDVHVHIFCGKTAGILFQKNPHSGRVHTQSTAQWEIMSKAGIKNKHGTGKDTAIALARTRCAMLPEDRPPPPSKTFDLGSSNRNNINRKKTPSTATRQFYLVREFEATLKQVREELDREVEKQQQQTERKQNQQLVPTVATTVTIQIPVPVKAASMERQVLGSLAASYSGSETAATAEQNHLSFEPLPASNAFGPRSTQIEVLPFNTAQPQHHTDFGTASSPTTTATTNTTTSPLPASPPMGSSFAPFFGGPVHSPGLLEGSMSGMPLMNFSTFPNATIVHPLPGRPLAPPRKGSLSLPPPPSKSLPIKIGQTHAKQFLRQQQQRQLLQLDHIRFDKHGALMDQNGKVSCPCGGRHKADDGTAIARQSWSTHALTKQHQKWLLQSSSTSAAHVKTTS